MPYIVSVIAPIFLIILGSALMGRFGRIDQSWSRVLNDFALKIGLPVLIFSSLATTPLSLERELPLLLSNSLFILASFGLALLVSAIFRLTKEMTRTLFICFPFCSFAYLGVPTLVQIYGDAILPTASLIVAIYIFWMFSVGVGFLDFSHTKNKKGALKKVLRHLVTNPLLIALLLGVVVSSVRLPIPGVLTAAMNMVTTAVTPTVLIVIGLFIGASHIGRLREWTAVLLFSLTTLFVLPAGFFLAVTFFDMSIASSAPSILQAAMPLGITPFALADTFDPNKTFISRAVVLSTVLSAISLPIWISLVT